MVLVPGASGRRCACGIVCPRTGPWATGTRHAQRHSVDIPDDLAEAATLVSEEELHLDLALRCGEVWSGLYNGHLWRQALGEDGVNINQGAFLLQELGGIAVQFRYQEIWAIETLIELLHRDVLRQSCYALVEAVADQARSLPIIEAAKNPSGSRPPRPHRWRGRA